MAVCKLRRTIKVNGTVVLVHAVKVHRGVKVAPRIRRVWMDLVTLTPFPFYPQSNNRRHSLNRKPAWPRAGLDESFTNAIDQRFSNFFQVGTTFISQNVRRTTILLGLSNSLGLP